MHNARSRMLTRRFIVTEHKNFLRIEVNDHQVLYLHGWELVVVIVVGVVMVGILAYLLGK